MSELDQVHLQTTESGKFKGAKVGVVESDKRAKTRRVVVQYSAKHPKYGKYVRKRTILQVHDENNESHLGDRVLVAPCRPISKTKSWTLVSIVEKAPQNVEADFGDVPSTNN
ncbi:MAG: 30S ribosomal protein S17 [Phycisphaerales bacterium]